MAELSRRMRQLWRLQKLLTPELRHAQYAFVGTLTPLLGQKPVWLDLGCGRAVVPEWLHPPDFARVQRAIDQATMSVGVDCDEQSLRDNKLVRKVRAGIERLPFAARSFDLVSANMVVEHLDFPENSLREIRRILKPGGHFVFHTPNLCSPFILASALAPEWLKRRVIRLVESRQDEDVFKTHYRLNTASVIRRCAKESGFSVVEIKSVCTTPISWVLGPFVIFELLMIRILSRRGFGTLRPNLIAVLERAE